jgi:hypothetical protein
MGAANDFRDALRVRFKSIYDRAAIGGTPSPTCWRFRDRKQAEREHDKLRRETFGWITHTVNTGFYMRVGRAKCAYNPARYYVCVATVRTR